MLALTRRHYPERQNCWDVYYGDVHVRMIRAPSLIAGVRLEPTLT